MPNTEYCANIEIFFWWKDNDSNNNPHHYRRRCGSQNFTCDDTGDKNREYAESTVTARSLEAVEPTSDIALRRLDYYSMNVPVASQLDGAGLSPGLGSILYFGFGHPCFALSR